MLGKFDVGLNFLYFRSYCLELLEELLFITPNIFLILEKLNGFGRNFLGTLGDAFRPFLA